MCHYDESNANELKQFILAKQTAENHFQTENPIEESEQKNQFVQIAEVKLILAKISALDVDKKREKYLFKM